MARKYIKVSDECQAGLKTLIRMAAFVPPKAILRNSEMLFTNSCSNDEGKFFKAKYLGWYLDRYNDRYNLSVEEKKELARKEEKVLELIDKEIEKFPLLYAYIHERDGTRVKIKIEPNDEVIAIDEVTKEIYKGEIIIPYSLAKNIYKYDEYISLRNYLKSFAAHCTLLSSNRLLPEFRDFYLNKQFDTNLSLSVNPRIDIEKEVIMFDGAFIIRALEEANPKRIKMCPICEIVFWAKKLNSETCGDKKCSDDLGNKKRLAKAKAQKEKLDNHFQSRIRK